LSVFGGSGGNINLDGMTGNRVITSGGTATWTDLEGSWNGNLTKGDYSLTITDVIDANTSYSITMGLVRCFEVGYGESFITYQGTRTSGQTFWNEN